MANGEKSLQSIVPIWMVPFGSGPQALPKFLLSEIDWFFRLF